MWKDIQNLILFKVGSGEEEVINLLHIYLYWFTCSNMQALYMKTVLKSILLMNRKLNKTSFGTQRLGNNHGYLH